ncbi:MAG: hypothetical protein WDN72_01200 [Alphaproteobacteria bacterium]
MQVMLKKAFARPIKFYSEFFALDLLMREDGSCGGLICSTSPPARCMCSRRS